MYTRGLPKKSKQKIQEGQLTTMPTTQSSIGSYQANTVPHSSLWPDHIAASFVSSHQELATSRFKCITQPTMMTNEFLYDLKTIIYIQREKLKKLQFCFY